MKEKWILAKDKEKKLEEVLKRLNGKKLTRKNPVLTTQQKIIQRRKLKEVKKNWIPKNKESTNPKKILKKQKKFVDLLEEQQALMDKKRDLVSGNPNKRKLLDRYKPENGKKGTIDKVKRVDW